MAGVIAEIGLAVVRFPGWWLGELAALVPAGLRRMIGGERGAVVFELSDDEVAISVHGGSKRREVGRVDRGLDRAAQRQAIARLCRRLNLDSGHVVLRLAEGHALRKRMELPLAAEENLREVLEFEMDRQTPFKPDEVRFDNRIVHRDPDSGRIQVELVVVPRSVVDEAVLNATEWGVPPDIVDIAGVPQPEIGGFNLLPKDYRPTRGRAGSVANAVLALAVVALSAAFVYRAFERQNTVIGVMGERVAEAKIEAEAAVALRERIEGLIEDGEFLGARKRQGLGVTAVIEELSRMLPDDTWIYQLRLNAEEVRVWGYARAASQILALIEASPVFAGVTFRSPVTQDQRVGLERFNLSARIVPRTERPE